MQHSVHAFQPSFDRKQLEAEFHDRRELDRRSLAITDFEAKYSNKKWYSISRRSREFTANWLNTHCDGAVALDYCCGLGGTSLQMAKAGAFVHGIDISEESVKTAEWTLSGQGFKDSCDMRVMDAEKLDFRDQTFDVVVCSGVLHHLDLDRAYTELARVLKPTGRILCVEAIGHNPLIQWYRKRTPHLRTAWEVDHILKRHDVQLAKSYFTKVDIHFFHLCSIAAVPFRNYASFTTLLAIFEQVDRILLKTPALRWWAWQMVFELSRPRPASQCARRRVA